MNREEFFEWLGSCPDSFIINSDEYGTTVIKFTYEEEEEQSITID